MRPIVVFHCLAYTFCNSEVYVYIWPVASMFSSDSLNGETPPFPTISLSVGLSVIYAMPSSSISKMSVEPPGMPDCENLP